MDLLTVRQKSKHLLEYILYKVGNTTFTGDQRVSVQVRNQANWGLVIEKVVHLFSHFSFFLNDFVLYYLLCPSLGFSPFWYIYAILIHWGQAIKNFTPMY